MLLLGPVSEYMYLLFGNVKALASIAATSLHAAALNPELHTALVGVFA